MRMLTMPFDLIPFSLYSTDCIEEWHLSCLHFLLFYWYEWCSQCMQIMLFDSVTWINWYMPVWRNVWRVSVYRTSIFSNKIIRRQIFVR